MLAGMILRTYAPRHESDFGRQKNARTSDFAGIRELGPENVVMITSDVGQRGSPTHPDAFKMALEVLLEAGIHQGRDRHYDQA